MEISNKHKTRIITCCSPPRCSCPEMELDFDDCRVEIRDDYQNICYMTFEDFTRLARQFLTEV